MQINEDTRIAVIGLGYVGLPLAVEFGKKYNVVGFDTDESRITELRTGMDRTKEIPDTELKSSNRLVFYSDPTELRGCNIFIVSVPTPVDSHNIPDLSPLIRASETVGSVLKHQDVVVYESTVYPGCTEEVCVPILGNRSGLKYNVDFFCGYSPERINPGDRQHRLCSIRKVTSGSNPATADFIDELYGSIISAGTYKASSIKVAEAAKAIENAQRDINIAFVNELAIIFDRMGLDTNEVLEAAATKWNFLKFSPGLVGGHCIGVDPYYLTYKAEELGYHAQVILSGRRINDGMGTFVANKVMKLMIKSGLRLLGARVLVAGITFKENCPDTRNSKVVDIVRELTELGCEVFVFDPIADPGDVLNRYRIVLIKEQRQLYESRWDSIVFAVAHAEFRSINLEIIRQKSPNVVVYDVKGFIKDVKVARL